MVVHDITLHGSWLLHITPNCDGFDPLQPWTHEGMGQVIQTGGCMRVFQVTRVLLRFLVPVYNLTHSHAACVHVHFHNSSCSFLDWSRLPEGIMFKLKWLHVHWVTGRLFNCHWRATRHVLIRAGEEEETGMVVSRNKDTFVCLPIVYWHNVTTVLSGVTSTAYGKSI